MEMEIAPTPTTCPSEELQEGKLDPGPALPILTSGSCASRCPAAHEEHPWLLQLFPILGASQ